MYESELERLKADFANLPVRQDAKLSQLRNELENVVRRALPKDEAKHYLEKIREAHIAFAPPEILGGEHLVLLTWPNGQSYMNGVIEGIQHSLRLSDIEIPQKAGLTRDMHKVFLVHGHDLGMMRDVDAFLLRIGIKPVILIDEPSRGQTVIEKFERNADVPFAVVLFSPDDVGRSHSAPSEDERRRPRQNAVLELGFFIGALGRSNVALMIDEELDAKAEYPSDYAGVIPILYRRDSDWKTMLLRELRASGVKHDPSKA